MVAGLFDEHLHKLGVLLHAKKDLLGTLTIFELMGVRLSIGHMKFRFISIYNVERL